MTAIETASRSTVAFVGAVFFTAVLILASSSLPVA